MFYLLHRSILLYSLLNTDKGQCCLQLCFNWRISTEALTLTCKTWRLYYRVSIRNPMGRVVADCLPPVPTVNCAGFDRNGIISQNPSTNETIYVVKGKLDKHLNGNWTCTHGRSLDVAKVEVTIIKLKDKQSSSKNTTHICSSTISDLTCAKENLLWTVVSYSVVIMISVMLMTWYQPLKFPGGCKRKCFPGCKGNARIKRTIFFMLATIWFGVAFITGFYDRTVCKYVWVFPVLSLFFSVPSSFVCLNMNGRDNPLTTIPNTEDIEVQEDNPLTTIQNTEDIEVQEDKENSTDV